MPGTRYEITRLEGRPCLLLTARDSHFTWQKVTRTVPGAFTLRFDFLFTDARPSPYNAAPGQYLYLDLWQDDGTATGMLHLTPEGVRAEFLPAGADRARQEPTAFEPEVRYALNAWHTARVVRIPGGILARIWPQDRAEPKEWTLTLFRPELDVSHPAAVRFQYYAAGSRERHLALANVVWSRQG